MMTERQTGVEKQKKAKHSGDPEESVPASGAAQRGKASD